jgi:hypothetical protein
MKESAVDMIAARIAATARPASGSGANPRRKAGAASSGFASGASFPCATRAGTASPSPSQISRQRVWESPSTRGSQRSRRGSRIM